MTRFFLGVVALPDLSELLRADGAEVVSGDGRSPRSDLAAVAAAAATSKGVVIVGDSGNRQVSGWVANNPTVPVVAVRLQGADLDGRNVRQVAAPAAVSAVLQAVPDAVVRSAFPSGPSASVLEAEVRADGSVPAPAPDFDPWAEFAAPEPEPAPPEPDFDPWAGMDGAPEPALPEPAPAPLPAAPAMPSVPDVPPGLDMPGPAPWDQAAPSPAGAPRADAGRAWDAAWDPESTGPVPAPPAVPAPPGRAPWDPPAAVPAAPSPPSSAAAAPPPGPRPTVSQRPGPAPQAGGGRPPVQFAAAPAPTASTWGGRRPAQVVSVVAFKGGAGKTTTARLLAARAAQHGIRAWLIDANGGQGGQQVTMRLTEFDLPNVLDVAGGAPPESAVLSPDVLNRLRRSTPGGAYLPDVGFHATFAPPREAFDPETVPAGVYGSILDAGRRMFDHQAQRPVFDLVVVDTQTAEMWQVGAAGTILTGLVLPEVAAGNGWVLGIAEHGEEGISNQLDGHRRLADYPGFTEARLMTALSMVPPGTDPPPDIEGLFGSGSVWLGAARWDEEVKGLLDTGQMPCSHPAVAPVLDAALAAVMGPGAVPAPPDPEPGAKARRKWWRR